jgi:hypothetical protein
METSRKQHRVSSSCDSEDLSSIIFVWLAIQNVFEIACSWWMDKWRTTVKLSVQNNVLRTEHIQWSIVATSSWVSCHPLSRRKETELYTQRSHTGRCISTQPASILARVSATKSNWMTTETRIETCSVTTHASKSLERCSVIDYIMFPRVTKQTRSHLSQNKCPKCHVWKCQNVGAISSRIIHSDVPIY